VVINEIAWMGTQASPSDEWIELFNPTTRPTDLTGWGLYEGGGSTLIIALSGVIEPHSYYLVERTDDRAVSDIEADLFGSWKGHGLSNDGEHLVLKDGDGNIVDEVDASDGWPAGDNEIKASMERNDPALPGSDFANWVTNDGITRSGLDAEGNPINGTPKSSNSEGGSGGEELPPAGEENPPEGEEGPAEEEPLAEGEPPAEEEQQPHPVVGFSAPASVSADSPFSVTVALEDFEPGTYSIKVLIGDGDRFYDGRTQGTDGKWLAWNAGWADFPTVAVGSSGSGSAVVQAKTDDDIAAGSYLIKVRAHKDSGNFDSEARPLVVTASVRPENELGAQESGDAGDGKSDSDVEFSFGGGGEDGGEVLGAEAPQNGNPKLNFYTILGAFGLLVGSGGLILSVVEKRGEKQGSKAEREALSPHSVEEFHNHKKQVP